MTALLFEEGANYTATPRIKTRTYKHKIENEGRGRFRQYPRFPT